jgi:Aromatic acid exporter family member 2
LTVLAGCFVGFIWTIFPSPLTERSVIRKDLGGSLFLLANYFSIVAETVDQRIQGTEGDLDLPNSPARKLEKVRLKVMGKLIILLNGLRSNSDFTKWEPMIGGKFPKKTYDKIIMEVQK